MLWIKKIYKKGLSLLLLIPEGFALNCPITQQTRFILIKLYEVPPLLQQITDLPVGGNLNLIL